MGSNVLLPINYMSIIDSISKLRRDYSKGKFDISNAADDPFRQFEIWFEEAMNSGMIEPTAMTVSTISSELKPSSRVVLLKAVDTGFVFFTNYKSRKGNEIDNNPNASLLFYWDKLERQIRIEGRLEKTNVKESETYFLSRPYESKVGAWASQQSHDLSSRFTLIREFLRLMGKFKNDVPLPPFWGGYRLIPDYFEFWQGRESRLHDRVVYRKSEKSWSKHRLYP